MRGRLQEVDYVITRRVSMLVRREVMTVRQGNTLAKWVG